jgi:hypothetical protein
VTVAPAHRERAKRGRPRKVWTDKLRAEKIDEMLRCAEAGLCKNNSQLSRHHRIPRGSLIDWRKDHPQFEIGLRAAWMGITIEGPLIPVPDFEQFRKECFGHDTYEHQREWFEALAEHDLNLILVPPEHAKTMTMSIEYPVWRIAKDRSVRIITVSKSQATARKVLMAVKKRLSDHRWYAEDGRRSVPREWGPFEPSEGERGKLPWTADMIYVSGIDSGEKDPTMEALGVKGQIYGARADVIICDDIATLSNQTSETEREKILEWLNQEVLTRLSEDGKLIIVGTRVHEADIYGTLLSENVEWASDFSKIVQPAITDEADKQTLWPQRWPYDLLVSKRRNRMALRNWTLVYQQQATGMPGAPFDVAAMARAMDDSYSIGSAIPGANVVMGVDPALEGTAAVVVVALDRTTGERWLIDCVARESIRTPEILKSLIVDLAYRYRISRCRIEKNAMQGLLSRDADLRRRLLAAGCQLEEEYTTVQNKYDPNWGVTSVAAQFDQDLWHLPAGPGSEHRVRPLVDELAAWRPGVKVKQDRVMALWLAELSARGFASYRPGVPTHQAVPPWVSSRRVPEWVRRQHAPAN